MKETTASASESKPSAKRVRLPLNVETAISATPIPTRVQTEIHAALLASLKTKDLSKKWLEHRSGSA